MPTLHTFTKEQYERYCAQPFMADLLILLFFVTPPQGADYEELYEQGNRFWNGEKQYDPFKHRRMVRDGLYAMQEKLDECFKGTGTRYVIEKDGTRGFKIAEKPEPPKVPPPMKREERKFR